MAPRMSSRIPRMPPRRTPRPMRMSTVPNRIRARRPRVLISQSAMPSGRSRGGRDLLPAGRPPGRRAGLDDAGQEAAGVGALARRDLLGRAGGDELAALLPA